MPFDQHSRHQHPGDGEVHSISNAAVAHSEDMHKRMVQYGLAMGIRLVCLILIFVVDGWFKILMVAGAVFLPWIAVVIANGSDQAEIHSDSLLDRAPLVELEASPARAPGDVGADGVNGAGNGSTDEPVILQGEVVPDDDEPQEQEKRAS